MKHIADSLACPHGTDVNRCGVCIAYYEQKHLEAIDKAIADGWGDRRAVNEPLERVPFRQLSDREIGRIQQRHDDLMLNRFTH